MRLDASGNLGLGVTPSAWSGSYKAFETSSGSLSGQSGAVLRLMQNSYVNASSNYTYVSTAAASMYLQSAGAHSWHTVGSGTAATQFSFTQAMTLDASGKLGIGATSPSGKLDVAGVNGTFRVETNGDAIAFTSNAANFISAKGGSSASLVFETGGAIERARITSSGAFLIGTATAYDAAGLTIVPNTSVGAAEIYWNRANNVGTSTVARFNNGGSTVGSISYTNSATTFATSSDYRLKEDVQPMTGALNTVAQLKPVTYKWKIDGSDGQGFIAHELAEVCPHAVVGEKDATRIEEYEISPAVAATFDDEGNELTPAVEAVMGEREVPVYQGIDTSFLVATLTAAIQEQQAIIQQLQADVAALKA